MSNFQLNAKVRTVKKLKSVIKNDPGVPVGTQGIVVFKDDNSVTVDFENIHFGKWAISNNIARVRLESV